MAEPQKWEYLVLMVEGYGSAPAEELNRVGEEGWESVAVAGRYGNLYAYLKRPKQ